MSNSIDPDEMAHYEPSHLDLGCLQVLLVSPGSEKVKVNFHYLTHRLLLF